MAERRALHALCSQMHFLGKFDSPAAAARARVPMHAEMGVSCARVERRRHSGAQYHSLIRLFVDRKNQYS